MPIDLPIDSVLICFGHKSITDSTMSFWALPAFLASALTSNNRVYIVLSWKRPKPGFGKDLPGFGKDLIMAGKGGARHEAKP